MLAAIDPLGVIMTILGLGFLIFFHELGHFIACRLTGTRVETFAVGFGPKIFAWRRGNTLYKIGWIPLGGYVKMAAENPGEARTDAPDEFPNKPFLARLFIMSNGVIFNVILALAFYIWGFRIGVPFPSAEIGAVADGGPAWEAGLRAGDVVTHVNDRQILGFDDLSTDIAFSDKDELLDLRIRRGDTDVELTVSPRYDEQRGMPLIQIEPARNPRMRGVVEDSPLASAGGRVGDTILAVDGNPVASVHDILRLVNRAAGMAPAGAAELRFLLRVRRDDGSETEFTSTVELVDPPSIGIQLHAGNTVEQLAANSPATQWVQVGDRILGINGEAVDDIRVFRDAAGRSQPVKSIRLIRGGETRTVVPDTLITEREFADSILGKLDFSSSVVSPRKGMPAARAGMRVGDRVVKVGSTKVTNWNQLRDAVREHGMKPIKLTVQRGTAGEVELEITPAGTPKYALFGYKADFRRVMQSETNIVGAMALGWSRTVLAMKSVALTIRSLVTRRVSARHVGGPIMLVQVTYGMFDEGFSRYLYILTLISINLAILNILPIPVLDGGQIVLLCAEKLRGKPLPDKVVGYFQMVGLLMILSLLVLAFRNDIVRLLN